MDVMPQHLYAPPAGLALGVVSDTVDPQSRGRVKVTLAALQLDVWAACIVPSAGQGYGVALLPKSGEVVVVAFLTPDQAFVLGAVWSGRSAMPDDAAPVAQRYAIRTAAGTMMVFDDDGPSVTLTTPQGNSLALTDAAGGSCTATVGGSSITLTPDGATLTTGSSIQLQTVTLTIDAAAVSVNAAMAQFSGVVQCDTLITNAVVSTSYSPGAGNLW